MPGSSLRQATQLHMQWWRQLMRRSAEQNNPFRLWQHQKLRRHRGQMRRGSSEKLATLQRPGSARDSWDNHSAREDSSGSNVEDMRNWLKALGVVVWGREGSDESSRNATRHGLQTVPELAKKGGQGEVRVPRAPEEPAADERARHEVTHLPYQPWCAWCVMERGRAKPHLQRLEEGVKVLEFEMDFCYLLLDPKRRHQPGDQAWATTLMMVDVTAQNPMCAALSTKSDENAYLSALCTTFVKRMVCESREDCFGKPYQGED